MFLVFTISNKAFQLCSISYVSYFLLKNNRARIIVKGNINPEDIRLNIPNPSPKISPLRFNSTVFKLRYPKIMKSKKPSIEIYKIGL